jgi:hypothetical protein
VAVEATGEPTMTLDALVHVTLLYKVSSDN